MAQYYAKADFKTAYLQREIVLDTKVATEMKVGDVVYNNNGTLTCRTSTTSGSAKNAVVVGDYIIAQSDMTMEYGHVPVENRNYAYSDVVAKKTTEKKVAVFKITNLDDVNLSEYSLTAART